MVMVELVQEVHDDLVALKNSVSIHDPIMHRLLDNLIKLTTIADDVEAEPESFRATSGPVAAIENGGPCPHKSVDIYGRCLKCRECQHRNVKHGVCLTCDQPIAKVG